jgi:hypothetical protein
MRDIAATSYWLCRTAGHWHGQPLNLNTLFYSNSYGRLFFAAHFLASELFYFSTKFTRIMSASGGAIRGVLSSTSDQQRRGLTIHQAQEAATYSALNFQGALKNLRLLKSPQDPN